MPPKILVIGNYRQTITLIRSLTKAGYHVIVGREDKRVFTQYSRYTSEIWSHPDIEKSEEAFASALAKYLADRQDIDFIFPIGETDIICLMHYPEAIPSSVGLVMADPYVTSTCLDKFRCYEIVSGLGIPQAPFRKVYNYASLLAAAEEIGYPCVIKPNNSLTTLFGRKALIVHEFAELKRAIPAWPGSNKFLLLQRWMPGYRHNCHFVADGTRLLAYFEQRVLRTDRLDGTGYGVDGISIAPDPERKAHCESLVTALNYSGAGCIQFLVDEPSRSMSFLEINPRLDATCALPYYCGYDFPRMAMQYAEYRRGTLASPPENFSTYPVGKRGVWRWGDVHGWLQAVEMNSLDLRESAGWLKKIAVTFFSRDIDLIWSWRDPLPACYLFAGLALFSTRVLIGKFRFHHRPRTREGPV